MLPDDFPFKDIFEEFLEEYRECTTYWYVPHTRTLNDENVEICARVLRTIFNDFLDRKWTRETQDDLLDTLRDQDILDPYREGTREDRTALTRIWAKWLEALGFLWIQHDQEIMITDAGLDLLEALDEGGESLRRVVSSQIVKFQYPHPGMDTAYADDYDGILPHPFLLQVLHQCGGELSYEEFDLFVNLAGSQDDVGRIARYITTWRRDLGEDERQVVRDIAMRIPMATGDDQLPLDDGLLEPGAKGTRWLRIYNITSYQRSFFGYPGYVEVDSVDSVIRAADPDQIEEVIREAEEDLKVTVFETLEDWIAYYGDPEQKPSWFTYLTFEVIRSESEDEARERVEAHKEELEEDEQEEIERRQIEKDIETFFVNNLAELEEGLTLVEEGRQYSTPIGRIDLLCRDDDGMYVVVEIKAGEANDDVFGQIQRYMGWIHRNAEDGAANVRGIILAGQFSEKARYSRIGLLRDDYDEVIQFKKHGLHAQDI